MRPDKHNTSKIKNKGRARRAPIRSPRAWAHEFIALLHEPSGVSSEMIEAIAAKDIRLRERLPSSVIATSCASANAANISITDWLKMAHRCAGLMVIQEKKVRRQIHEIERALIVGPAEARRHIQAQPMLLGYGKGVLQQRMTAMQRTTGLPSGVWHHCVRRQPGLLTRKPAAFVRLVRGHRRVLGLTTAEYCKLVVREPRLLACSPDHIDALIREMIARWGFCRDEARALILRAPKLARGGNMATMDRNVGALARGFGVEKARVVAALRLFPPLAYQKPEHLLRRLEAGAVALGVQQETLFQAVLRSPSLSVRRTEVWGTRMRLIRRIARALAADLSADDVLAKLPSAMTYSRERLMQRYVVARLGLWTWNWTALLTVKDENARRLLDAYFIKHPERLELRAALAKRGLA